jgi:hypothetical protein
MPVFQGNATGSVIGIAYNIPSYIKSFSITDMSGSGADVAVYIAEQGTVNKTAIFKDNIPANSTYLSDVPITMLQGYTIYITTSASIDYYFTIE